MFKKISAILLILTLAFSLTACSVSDNSVHSGSDSSASSSDKDFDWTQGIAPSFAKTPENKFSFPQSKLYNGKYYNTLTVASFANCSQKDFDTYAAALIAAGFTLTEGNDKAKNSKTLKYFVNAKKSIVVISLEKGYLSITVADKPIPASSVTTTNAKGAKK